MKGGLSPATHAYTKGAKPRFPIFCYGEQNVLFFKGEMAQCPHPQICQLGRATVQGSNTNVENSARIFNERTECEPSQFGSSRDHIAAANAASKV